MHVVISIFLIISGISIYLTTLRGEFITLWDDNVYVVSNELIKKLDLQLLYKIFTTPHYTDYYPLQLLSYAVDYRMWGLNPYGYHLSSILIHILNSVLVYVLFGHLINNHAKLESNIKEAAAAFGAFIFLVHPTNIETVAWVSERKNLLSATFYILSFLFYSKYKLKGKRLLHDLSLIAFLFALLSKSSVVVLPLLLFVYQLLFFPSKQSKRSLLYDTAPFFIMAAVFSVLIILIHSNIGAIYDYPGNKPIYTFYTMLKVIALYIKNSLFPFNLSPIYFTTISEFLFEPSVLLSASILTIVIAYGLSLKSNDRLIFFSMFLFFIPFLPVSHIVPIAIYMTDRYLYLPLIGFSLFFSLLLFNPMRNFSSKSYAYKTIFNASLLISILIIYQLSILNIKQGHVWQDETTVWAKVVKENPGYASGYLTLGVAYLQNNNDIDAFAYVSKALELGLTIKERKNAHYYRAMALILHNDLMRGERELERLRKIDPNFPLLHYAFGILYAKKGQSEKATEALQKFVNLYEIPYKNFEDPLVRDANKLIERLKKGR